MPAADVKKILVVDDEPDVTAMVSYNLKKEGYEVEALHEPVKIMGIARQLEPHLFILDVMMPGIDGIQICRMLRADPAFKEIPIIFLTACEGSEARIKGLESGADDYIPKPFEIKELILRVNSLFRRTASIPKTKPDAMLQIGPVILEESRHRVSVDGKEVHFTATEFQLLHLLMKRQGRVQTRDNLLINVWEYEADVETRTVDTHIRRLRKKLGSASNLIETIRGVGYRFLEPAKTIEPSNTSASSRTSRSKKSPSPLK